MQLTLIIAGIAILCALLGIAVWSLFNPDWWLDLKSRRQLRREEKQWDRLWQKDPPRFWQEPKNGPAK